MLTNARVLIAAVLALAAAAVQAEPKQVKCRMTFEMKGWSAIYETSTGTGVIKCSNGQTAKVTLDAKGGGVTAGKSEIDEGFGKFSAVGDISDLFGSYIAAKAHAGAVKSTQGQVMTKGEVSLAWHGKGRGWDLGVALGRLKIEKAG